MPKLLLHRLLYVIPTFIGIVALTFFLIRLAPGDPILLMAGEHGVSPERYAELRQQLGFDQPILLQFTGYLWQVLNGNLGISVVTQTPVLEEFGKLFPATLELAIIAMILAVSIALPAGVLAAVKRNTIIDHSITAVSLVGYSMPIFWWALLLILLFSVNLGWMPVAGRLNFIYDIESVTGFMLIDTVIAGDRDAFLDALRHLTLPAIVLATIPLAVITRMTRSSMLEVLKQDYIRTARAKGLSESAVIFKHALRNALIPVITVIGLQTSILMTGAILTETIFSWPGIGKWLLEAVYRRDYPVVQGGVLLIAGLVILVNTVVDMLYVVINPRLRQQ
ncbi:MAG: ABC transporter permease subunit [Gammaproteobacteria bacterium]|nr:ABC transporter permease subunit [Gammaproteobacteria bacterium]MDX2486491.1 ABC transporter permease subunit [Gammaproteobacteria bacterium]